MKAIRSFALVAAGLTMFSGLSTMGCAADAQSSMSEDDLRTYASPGTDLGRATRVVADVEDDAAFVVYNRNLERRAADGTVTPIGRVGLGFESLVVSKKLAAYLTASFVNGGGTKVLVHVLSRAQGWKEIRTEDLSTNPATFRHPIAFIDDDTIAVGSGDEVVFFGASGARTVAGGDASPFHGHEVFSIHPSGNGSLYANLDNGAAYAVNAKTKALKLQPARESDGALSLAFDPKSKTWITTDFEGIKIFGTDGKLVRKADLVTQKGRYISASALLPDGKLLVSHQSEASQERSVVATYDLASLARTEIGTFDGVVDQLGPSGSGGKLFFAFSPKGAAGFNSRVWYARVRPM